MHVYPLQPIGTRNGVVVCNGDDVSGAHGQTSVERRYLAVRAHNRDARLNRRELLRLQKGERLCVLVVRDNDYFVRL
jgi:hypothetical protein